MVSSTNVLWKNLLATGRNGWRSPLPQKRLRPLIGKGNCPKTLQTRKSGPLHPSAIVWAKPAGKRAFDNCPANGEVSPKGVRSGLKPASPDPPRTNPVLETV